MKSEPCPRWEATDAARSEIRDHSTIFGVWAQLQPTMNIEKEYEPNLVSARGAAARTRTRLARADGGEESRVEGSGLVSAGTCANVDRPAVQRGESDVDSQAERADRLTPEERALWRELNEKVKHGVREIRRLGEALYEIRQKRLYREDFSTWKDYCETVLEMSKPQANRLIVGTEVLADLAPFGATNLPDGESQLRELARLPTAELRRIAWAAVLDQYHTSKITAKVVREKVEKIRSQNGIASSRQESSADTSLEKLDSLESKSQASTETKPRRFEAEYIESQWFKGRDENRFLLADGSECDSARSTSEESFITATQITDKLTSMAQNNDWAKKHAPKTHISDSSIAERQRLLVTLVDVINEFATQSADPSTRATVFHAVEELCRLTTYLKPPSTTDTNPALPETSFA